MMLLVLLLAALLTYGVARAIVRVLGWPRDLSGAMRWAMSLVVCAVVYAGLPEIMRLASPMLPGPLPEVVLRGQLPIPEVLAAFGMVGLGFLGYVAWRGGAEGREAREREEAATRRDVRRRALPPVPHAGAGGFTPIGAHVEPPDDPTP